VRKHLHWFALLLFVWAFGYDLVIWGAARNLPDIGDKLHMSAQRNALLATMYMAAGRKLDNAVPALEDWGEHHVQNALADGIPRIKDDPNVAMDLIFSQTWNSSHFTLKLMYWAAPILGLIALVLWARRPKKISLIGGSR
jgi:hypothetical protein